MEKGGFGFVAVEEILGKDSREETRDVVDVMGAAVRLAANN